MGEPDEGEVLKAEDTLLKEMLSPTVPPHRGHGTKSPCGVGGAEREEALSNPLGQSADREPSREIGIDEIARLDS